MWRYLAIGIGALLSGFAVWVNIGVHRAPQVGSEEELVAVRAQLAYLEPRMHAGLPDAMQRLFPEGAVFSDALYGLAWCQLAQRTPTDVALRAHALVEAKYALADMERPSVQAPFVSGEELLLGVFYNGWRNLLVGSIARLDPSDTVVWRRWEQGSDELRQAFASQSSPYLCSYPGMAWPADNVVAIASIVRCARAHGVQDDAVVRGWVKRARASVDARGLIPHAWDPVNERVADAGRGSSQVLMNAFMPEIDGALAAEQFAGLRNNFLAERCGVPVVREHPHGTVGVGDVDSGPLILGAGASATVVGAAAFRANGDSYHAQELDATCEGFGLACGGARKRFLLGALPITDLFLAWARTMPVERAEAHAPGFLRFHLWSAALVVLLLLPLWWRTLLRWRSRRDYLGAMRFVILLFGGTLLAVPSVTAQTVLDGSSAPAVGQSYDYDIADTLDLPGIGAGQVWDASAAVAGQTDNVTFDAVSNGQVGSTFPGADVVMFTGPSEIYVDAAVDGLYVLGTYNGSLPITSVYTDPQRYLQLPCSLGTGWSDPYAGSYDYAGNTYAQSGNATFLATGYGSLVLPWGTVDNVLRVDGSEDYLESGNGNTYAYTATFTTFHKPGLGYFVARQVSGTGVLNGSNVVQLDQFIYMQASSIGFAENDAVAFGMEVHPNPVVGAGTLVYTATGDLTLQVFDAAGRCQRQRALGQVMPGLHRTALPVDDLPAGLYTAVLQARDGARGVVRFVVER